MLHVTVTVVFCIVMSHESFSKSQSHSMSRVIAIVIVSHKVIVRVIFYFTRLDFNKDYATRALESII